MSLEYLSGIGANRRQAKKTAKVEAKAQRKEIKQVSRQKRVSSAAKFVTKPAVKVLKAVAKQSKLAAQKIQKQRVVKQQRRAFKKAGEPVKLTEETLQAEESYDLPVQVEEGTQEVDEPEFENSNTGGENEPEEMEDLGIVYPDVEISGKRKSVRQLKKATKKATNAPLKAVKKAKRAEVLKKVGTAALSVAKATLEAKGIKFPTKEQIQDEATKETPETSGGSYIMPIVISGAALAIFLLMKKK